jgi:DNA-binding response OmpR family regulator
MKKPTILALVVEDEEVLSALIKKKFERENIEVVCARTADDGLKILKERGKVDFIWLDHYLLGDKDGIDFVKEVKKNKDWQDIPIFVVSNTAGPEKKKLYCDLGITKYYVKADYQLDEIIEEIRKILKQK